MNDKAQQKRWLKRAVVCIGIALLLEIFFFNFRTFQSWLYPEKEIPGEQIRLDGFDPVADGTYRLREDAECGMIYLTGLDTLLEDKKLCNLYLELELPEAADVPYAVSGLCTIAPYIRDEGNDNYVELEDHFYRQDNEASKYLWFQGAGTIRTIVLRTSFSEGGMIAVRNAVINRKRPLQFSVIRCMVLFLLLFSGCAIWKASWEVAEKDTDRKNERQNEMLVTIVVGLALLLPAAYLIEKNEYVKGDISFRPYQQLAEALEAGQYHLLQEPTEQLKQLPNPYDYTAREAAGLVKNVDYMWDTAYYKGHYYVYFGVLPCLLFYLPVKLLTGQHIQDSTVILICAVFLYAGILALVRNWCRGRKQRVSFVMQMMTVVTLFMGSNVMACLGAPDAHDVPRMCGLCFLVWGLNFWIASVGNGEKDGFRKAYMAVGSLCMALAVGCRPNLAFYSFLAGVLFWKKGKLFGVEKGKELIGYLTALMLPYVPVAVGLMYYNAVRFGSILDFGYLYNLTVHDYNFVIFSFDKIVIALYDFLLKFPALDYVFPYLKQGVFSEIDRLGHTDFYLTYSYGGLLVCNLILWSIPVLFSKEARKNKSVQWAIALVLFAFVQIFINMMTGGVSYNYLADFAVPLLLAGWEGAYEQWERLREENGRLLYKKYLMIAFAWAFLFYANFYFVGSLDKGNTELYYKIFYAFNFF